MHESRAPKLPEATYKAIDEQAAYIAYQIIQKKAHVAQNGWTNPAVPKRLDDAGPIVAAIPVSDGPDAFQVPVVFYFNDNDKAGAFAFRGITCIALNIAKDWDRKKVINILTHEMVHMRSKHSPQRKISLINSSPADLCGLIAKFSKGGMRPKNEFAANLEFSAKDLKSMRSVEEQDAYIRNIIDGIHAHIEHFGTNNVAKQGVKRKLFTVMQMSPNQVNEVNDILQPMANFSPHLLRSWAMSPVVWRRFKTRLWHEFKTALYGIE